MKYWFRSRAIGALAARPVASAMAPLLHDRASIFMLHRFRDAESGLAGHDPGLLRTCLENLRRRRVRVVSLEELVRRVIDGKPLEGRVAFTMDDGFWDQAEIGARVFLEYDVPVTCFLITGFQDGDGWPWDDKLAYCFEQTRAKNCRLKIGSRALQHDLSDQSARYLALEQTRYLLKQLPPHRVETCISEISGLLGVDLPTAPPRKHRPIGWERIRELEEKGVSFGPHSMSHGILSQMDDELVRKEILGSWHRLQSELREPLNIFCWPTGRFSDFGEREIGILREQHFSAALATENDYASVADSDPDSGRFRIRRFSFPDTLEDFLQYSSWIERAKQKLRGLG